MVKWTRLAPGRGGSYADQVVPAGRDLADQRVVAQPLELVQLEPAGGVHVVGRERRAAGAVHQHHRRPVLLLVLRLHRAEELHLLLGHVLVLDHLDGVALVAQLPEPGDVVAS